MLVPFNRRTAYLRIGAKFALMHTTYHIVHLIYRAVDVDRQYGIIHNTARKSAGVELA